MPLRSGESSASHGPSNRAAFFAAPSVKVRRYTPASSGTAEKRFVGLIMGGGKTIGRVNVYDVSPGGNGAEGITQLEAFVPAPAALALLGAGLIGSRRRRR